MRSQRVKIYNAAALINNKHNDYVVNKYTRNGFVYSFQQCFGCDIWRCMKYCIIILPESDLLSVFLFFYY